MAPVEVWSVMACSLVKVVEQASLLQRGRNRSWWRSNVTESETRRFRRGELAARRARHRPLPKAERSPPPRAPRDPQRRTQITEKVGGRRSQSPPFTKLPAGPRASSHRARRARCATPRRRTGRADRRATPFPTHGPGPPQAGRGPAHTSAAMTVDRPSLYTVLGLTPQATPDQVKHAYRALLRKHHPDTRPLGNPPPTPIQTQRSNTSWPPTQSLATQAVERPTTQHLSRPARKRPSPPNYRCAHPPTTPPSRRAPLRGEWSLTGHRRCVEGLSWHP